MCYNRTNPSLQSITIEIVRLKNKDRFQRKSLLLKIFKNAVVLRMLVNFNECWKDLSHTKSIKK